MNDMGTRPALTQHHADPRGGVPVEGMLLSGFERGIELEFPSRVASLTRLGHIPFLFWIVETSRPTTIVELGVGDGNSYCALLQASSHLGLEVRCFGVDPWSDADGEDAYRSLCGYHDPLYGTFSTLVRSSHDAATAHFLDKTIDLLHVAGTPSSNLTAPELERWLTRMSSRGFVVFHDINGSVGPAAAWPLWEGLRQRYPTFEFLHSNGLGIAYVGGDPLPDAVKPLFDGTLRADRSHMRAYFARLGLAVHEHEALREAQVRLASADLRVRALENEIARGTQARLARQDRSGQNLRQQMALIARLQREVSTLNRKKIAWEQILESTSWRITAPLRWLVIKIRWPLVKLATWKDNSSA